MLVPLKWKSGAGVICDHEPESAILEEHPYIYGLPAPLRVIVAGSTEAVLAAARLYGFDPERELPGDWLGHWTSAVEEGRYSLYSMHGVIPDKPKPEPDPGHRRYAPASLHRPISDSDRRRLLRPKKAKTR